MLNQKRKNTLIIRKLGETVTIIIQKRLVNFSYVTPLHYSYVQLRIEPEIDLCGVGVTVGKVEEMDEEKTSM